MLIVIFSFQTVQKERIVYINPHHKSVPSIEETAKKTVVAVAQSTSPETVSVISETLLSLSVSAPTAGPVIVIATVPALEDVTPTPAAPNVLTKASVHSPPKTPGRGREMKKKTPPPPGGFIAKDVQEDFMAKEAARLDAAAAAIKKVIS